MASTVAAEMGFFILWAIARNTLPEASQITAPKPAAPSAVKHLHQN